MRPEMPVEAVLSDGEPLAGDSFDESASSTRASPSVPVLSSCGTARRADGISPAVYLSSSASDAAI